MGKKIINGNLKPKNIKFSKIYKFFVLKVTKFSQNYVLSIVFFNSIRI